MRDLAGAQDVRIETGAARSTGRRGAPVWKVEVALPEDLAALAAQVDPLIPSFAVASAIRDLEAKLIDLVRLARAHGHTWTKIGEALGISKQAAWERFSGEE